MVIEDFLLANRQAVVIGGARGIGRGIALGLAEAGAAVAVVSRSQDTVESTVARVKAFGVDAFGCVADATDSESMDHCAKTVIGDLPDLDIVVNCVGDSMRQSVVKLPGGADGMSSSDWHNIVDINLTSAFEGCRVFGSHLIQRQHGSVINVSGVRAFRALPNGTAYSAGKAALAMLTQSLALEWAPFGIRVNALAPGLSQTRNKRRLSNLPSTPSR